MRKFKKSVVAIVMAASMLLSVGGCGKNSDKNVSETTEIATETDAEGKNSYTASESDADNIAISTELSVYSQPDPDSEEALAEQESFAEYLDESFKANVVSDTITMHYNLKDPESYGVEAHEVGYGDIDLSRENLEEGKTDCEDDLEELREFDYDLLTSEQKLTYDILENLLETNLESYDYIDFSEPFAYTSGLQSNFPITMSLYAFYDTGDVEDYLSLLNQTGEYFKNYLDFETEKSQNGYFMSDDNANEVIRQCNEFIQKPEENLLIETFNDRISDVPGITDEQIAQYTQENYDAVMNSVIPAYESIIETFKALKGTGTNDGGLANFENGKDYYEYLLRSDVGTDKTPEEIIEILEDKIDEVMSELYTLALTDYEAYQSYYENVDSLYDDVEPKETIEYYEECFADRFPEIPEIDFTVSPVHESLENIVSPAFYMTPPLDDYTNNTICTNLGNSANDLWSTLAHEGVPGHMYQFVYFFSNDPEPLRALLDFTAYSEGWATYVELMSYDYFEAYAEDVYADFERINSELSLLISARIEIGVNYEGWTLDETADYMNENGFNGDAASDIFRYVTAEPVNYQMYVFGWLEIQGMRDKAEAALGDSFNETEFHKVILDAGPCQFFLLEKLVEDYISMS